VFAQPPHEPWNRPTKSDPLLSLVHDVFMMANDRIYAKVDRTLKTRLEDLVKDPTEPFTRREHHTHRSMIA